jgi:hypothetical protein
MAVRPLGEVVYVIEFTGIFILFVLRRNGTGVAYSILVRSVMMTEGRSHYRGKP